jgi:hypothetical protein
MTTPAERFFNNLFDEKDFVNLTVKTSISMTVSGTAWIGNLFFPTKIGETSTLKSACFIFAILAGGAAIYFGIKREKPLRKKSVLLAIEDNEFVQKSSIVTGLNAENAVHQLEECLKKDIKHETTK